MSVDLIKLQEDLTKMRAVLKEYTWFCSDLKKRLYALIDMKSIGVGEEGLWYVSVDDVKLLIAWANKFQFSQEF